MSVIAILRQLTRRYDANSAVFIDLLYPET